MENKDTRKELIVSALENGTVIDHIPPKSVVQVFKILELEKYNDQVLFGINLESRRHGKKGLIKIKNKFFKLDEINKIALVAPTATLIVIKDFKIIEKKQVETPDTVENIVKCFNPNCVTNNEAIPTKFTLIDKDELKLLCHYCEKTTAKDNIKFL